MATCIITGCVLVDESYPRWCYGDLYMQGNQLIHNRANIPGTPEITSWCYDPIPDDSKPTVYSIGTDLFEKRGVCVVDKANAQFNKAAAERVGSESYRKAQGIR